MLPEELRSNAVAAAIEQRAGDALTGASFALGELTVYVEAARLVEICRFLKSEQKFNRLASITCVDWRPREPRFEVVYHLHSLDRNERVRLKVRVASDDLEVDSVTGVWRAANWYEREVFDLFGIRFRNHPDMRRIMMPDEWKGHPLRKDVPVHGDKYSYQDE